MPVGDRFRILIVHESYAQQGGEDTSTDLEASKLVERGHQVFRWTVSNKDIESWPLARKVPLSWRTTWSHSSHRTMLHMIRERKPDVVHFHNTLPLISPSAIHAAHSAGTAVVMTLHNYRLLCPAGTFLRDGLICEDCSDHSLLRSVVHGCYRGSRVQTAAVAAMLSIHRVVGTWSTCVDAYVALTEFMRAKLVKAGLPRDRVYVNHNVVSSNASRSAEPRGSAIYVGRLSREKGISTLLEASRTFLGGPLWIIGTGPMESEVRAAAALYPDRIYYVGQLPHEEVLSHLASAAVLLVPSLCYEGMPRSILEAQSCGIPIIASNLGGIPEAINHGEEGFLISPGNAADLARYTNAVLADSSLREQLSHAARLRFERSFSPERSYDNLMRIYAAAIENSKQRKSVA